MIKSAVVILLLLGLVFSARVHARVELDRLMVWQPDPDGIRYVLPRPVRETPTQFVERWQRALKSSRTYGKMENAQKLNLNTGAETFSDLPYSTAEHPNVAVVLNRPNQMYVPPAPTTPKPKPVSTYLQTAVRSFEAEGVRLYSIPIGLEMAVKPRDLDLFRKRLNTFDGQLGVGGDDPHPLSYGQKSLKGSLGDVSFKRDIEQSAYIQEYLRNGRGRVFYICGSMQRAAIADGHGFHADIGGLTADAQRGIKRPVMLEVTAEPGSELAIAAGSTRFKTSNFHHAAVDDTKSQPGRRTSSAVTAFNIEADGRRGRVVKAIEFPGNAGFATQFHPEFRGSPEENRIVHYISTGWKLRGRVPPRDIVSCMGRAISHLPTHAMAP